MSSQCLMADLNYTSDYVNHAKCTCFISIYISRSQYDEYRSIDDYLGSLSLIEAVNNSIIELYEIYLSGTRSYEDEQHTKEFLFKQSKQVMLDALKQCNYETKWYFDT